MYVCLCNAITDKDIKQAVTEQGVGNIRDLRAHMAIANQCGKKKLPGISSFLNVQMPN